jgi:feruloyl esterase
MRILFEVAAAITISAALARAQGTPPNPNACKDLAALALPDAKVVSAEPVPPGGFTPPAGLSPWMAGDPAFWKSLPAFCRVVVKATPSSDSDIAIEVWMPETWNGRFRGQGNGGFAGEIDYISMGAAVLRGYATAGTNTGHAGAATDATWALGHPEKVTDFGYRAIHVMTDVAKAAIERRYGRRPERSYFGACSNGGRQALMEAQRFPEDYDGILAGAPANYWTHLLAKALADAQATTVDPATYIPPAKLPALSKAVNAACDAQDGVTDGVLTDPRRCRFDPETLACKGAESDACLTAAQVKTLGKLYEGPRDASGREIFPGFLPGAEEYDGGWAPWITGPAPGKSLLFAFATGYYTNMVYESAAWDYRTANLQDALKAGVDKTAAKLDAVDPDLSRFQSRGGKLVVYHGWNDPAISAVNTVHYYDSVVGRMGAPAADRFLRLYMVAGLQHCGGGPGVTSFGQLGAPPDTNPQHNVAMALERWVETGEAPAAIVASKFVDGDRQKGLEATRPVCPYPQAPVYRGQGNTNDAASFECRAGAGATSP